MTIRQLFVIITFFSLLGLAATETVDPDMWWHLRAGEYIVQHGIPHHDVFSFTVPEHEWITHEWLSEVFMWLVYSIGGLPGLMLAFMGIITLALWLVYLRCEGRPYIAGLVVVLAAATSSSLWGSRPQMFNFLFFALFIFIVEGYRQTLSKGEGKQTSNRSLWLLPLLTALWANLHSGYLLGVVYLATVTGGEFLQQYFATRNVREAWASVQKIALVAVASLLAALLNPSGYELWIYPFLTLGSPVMQSRILEWWSPDFHNPYNWPFAAMLALGVWFFLKSRQPPTWTDLLLFMGTGAAGLLSIRHIPLFSLVATPILARYALASLEGSPFYPLFSGELPSPSPSPRMKAIHWTLAGIVILLATVHVSNKIAQNPAEIATLYPQEAVAFLQETKLAQEHGFNNYNWGGYLIWHQIPVFADGRADVYGDAFLRRYFEVADLGRNWHEPLDEFAVQYLLIERSSSLATLLDESDDWVEVYQDRLAAIFVRSAIAERYLE